MHISTKICAAVASAFLFSAAATAAPALQGATVDLTKFVYKGKNTSSAFTSDRAINIENNNRRMFGKNTRRAAEFDAEFTPVHTYGPSTKLGDIDGPNGEIWFYTMELDNEAVQYEWYTDYILRGYEINIYNAEHKLVGSIKDKMDYAADEVRVPYIDILPVLSKNFFNDDDKFEVIVGLAINSSTPGNTRYRSLVYSLDGETDEDGDSKVVYSIDNLVSDVLDATVPGGKERFFLTLMGEEYPAEEAYAEEGDSEGDQNTAFWENLLRAKITLTTYGKVGADGKMTKIISHSIPCQMLPGDQESVSFCISMLHGEDPLMIYHQYGEPLFNPYYDYNDDMTQRESNTIKIEMYKLGDTSAELVQTTEIPFVKDSDPTCIASFFSIGNFKYTGDIDFDNYESNGKAAFIVNRQNKYVGQDESYISSFYVHNPDGTRRFTLFEGAEGFSGISDLPGFAPLTMFIENNGGYTFHMVNNLTGEKEASFSNVLEIDGFGDPLTSNVDRVAYGDSYAFVGELRSPSDEDDFTFMRFAWLDKTGKVLFTDEVNMGLAVHYAMSFISSATLQPNVFHSDDNREYMMLIKRGQEDGTATEELLICQPRDLDSEDNYYGKDILLLTPNENGVLGTIMPYSAIGVPKLTVMYYNQAAGTYTVDVYDLPLDNPAGAGIKAPEAAAAAGNIAFNGTALTAAGEYIEVYNLQGIRVAAAAEAVSVAHLPAGTYIARTSEGALKFIKK